MRRHRQLVQQRAGHLRRDVLHQRSPARDVEHLHAAADRENRQVLLPRRGHELQFELVAVRVHSHHRLVWLLAVAARRDVVSTGHHQAVESGERLLDRELVRSTMRTSPPAWRIAWR